MARRDRATARRETTKAGGGRMQADGEQRYHASPWARPDSADAFVADPGNGPAWIEDDLAETLAEEYVRAATTGEYSDEALEQVVPEEIGGPFIETSAREEFAQGVDESNPQDATAEPLPRAVSGFSPMLAEEALDEGEDRSEDED